MKFLIFPSESGVFALNSKKEIKIGINSKGKTNILEKKQKDIFKFFNIFFIRGFFYFIFGLFFTIKGYFSFDEEDINNLKKNKTNKEVLIKNFVYVGSIILALVGAFFLFGYLPLTISFYLAPKNFNIFIKRFIIAIIKLILLYLLFLIIKFIPMFNQFLKFNSACKKYQEENNQINFLAYLICSIFLNTFIISIIGFSASVWYFFVINIIISLVVFSINYEIYKVLNKNKFANKILFPFEWLILQKYSQNEEKCVNIVVAEINRNLKGGYMQQNLQKDEVLFTDAYFTAKSKLEKANKFEESDLDYIFCEILNKKRGSLKLTKKISAQDFKKVLEVVEKRANGQPITKIFGRTNFYGLDFNVTKDVLSPRMDTEVLVETVLNEIKDKNVSVLDIGTGSGAIAVTIAKLSKAKVTAVDISDKALEVAKSNAEKNEAKVNFIKSDLFSAFKKKEKFDVIISNPPYIPTTDLNDLDEEVLKYDPALALDGGEDGLNFYRAIILKAPAMLSKNGKIFFEVGINQALSVKKLLQKNFKDIRIVKDYNKIERVVCATLI